VVNGKYEHVLKLLQNICRVNSKHLPKDFSPTCLLSEVLNSTTSDIQLSYYNASEVHPSVRPSNGAKTCEEMKWKTYHGIGLSRGLVGV